jgi:hypothetical protein
MMFLLLTTPGAAAGEPADLARPVTATIQSTNIPCFSNSFYGGPAVHKMQVLRLVSLPIWHGLSHGRLQLELAAQPALAKRWKALLKKEAKAAAGGSKSKKKDKGKAKAADTAAAGDAAAAAAAAGSDDAETAAAAAELPRAEAAFLPGMIQEFLSVLRAADAQLGGQQQQQQPQAVADADVDHEEAEDDDEEAEEDEQAEEAAAAAEAEPAAAENQAEHAAADAAENAVENAAQDAANAANGHQQQQQQRQSRKQQQQRKRAARNQHQQQQRLLLRHLERFVEWLIDLLSQLPTRRFVHALLEDKQLLVKVRLV